MSRELVELHGIILKTIPYKENDVLLQLLTAEKGKVIIYAKQGGKTNKSNTYKRSFAYSTFELQSRGHGMMVYSGSSIIDYFPELSLSPNIMATGEYLCEVSTFVPENIDNPHEYLSLLLNSLYLLSGRKYKDPNYRIIKLVFEIGFLQLSGLMPQPDVCSVCGDSPVYWHFDEGFLCENCSCKYSSHALHPVNLSIMMAIKHIMTTNGVSRYTFTMNKESLDALILLSEEYLRYKLETDLKTLNVYKQLDSL